MINQNKLLRNVLITPNEVAFHAPIAHEWDERAVGQNIIPAEERFIRVALSSKMYEDIRAEKNKTIDATNMISINAQYQTNFKEGDVVNSMDFLSADYRELWIEHLWKICAECVAFTATPEGYVKQTNAGIVQSAPTQSPLSGPNIVAPDLRAVKWSMDKKLEDRINPLIYSMHLWICDRIDRFPLYDKECPCKDEPIAFRKKTNVILGIYDDDEKCGCKW